jgi:hypothetical protein
MTGASILFDSSTGAAFAASKGSASALLTDAARADARTMNQRQLIVSADDFGMSEAVNDAIIRAHRDGVLTSAGGETGERKSRSCGWHSSGHSGGQICAA